MGNKISKSKSNGYFSTGNADETFDQLYLLYYASAQPPLRTTTPSLLLGICHKFYCTRPLRMFSSMHFKCQLERLAEFVTRDVLYSK